MKLQSHIDKISWTLGDKVIFIIYGFVSMMQFKISDPSEIGIYYLLLNLYLWIFLISDGIALQSMIQFGMNPENRRKVNTLSLILHISITLGASLIIFSLQKPLADIFSEPRLVTAAWYLPLFVLLTIPRNYCIKIALRDRNYRYQFMMDLAFFGTMTIITGYYYMTKSSLVFHDLVIMYLSGLSVSSLLGIFLTKKELIFGLKGNIRIKEMLSFTIPYGLYATLHSLPRNLDIYAVQFFFGTSSSGVYQSAKTLFRVFEELTTASYGLVYPPAVSLMEKKDDKGLNDLITKAVSFLLFLFVIMIIFLEAGGSRWLITLLLPSNYYLAIDQFNILILAALAMPFMITALVITASGKPKIVLGFVSASLAMSAATYYFAGISGNPVYMPLGVIIYVVSLGTMCFIYVNRKMGFKIIQVFRAFSDTRFFIMNFLNRSKSL